MDEPVRILLADDSDVDRLVLSAIVRREGYAVAEAVDGHDALRQFRSFRPHMVLLDALMPGLDGFEVARRIKAEAGEDFVPIIFLTSLTEADALARAVDAGGDDFLSKPYNQIILKAKLNALQRMRAMHVTMQRQRDEIGRHHAHLLQEQEAAKAVFDNVARTDSLDAPFLRHLISPLAIFNGDVLLSARNPSGNLHLLLGDFTGHGLTAAIGAMPLAEIFYGMTQKGFYPGDILREANRKLGDILPKGYFCCATLVAVNFHKGVMEFWNGGLPAARLYRPATGELVHLDSTHLPLGILGDERFDPVTRVVHMTAGDRLLMCTDGMVEARNNAGQAFGEPRMDDIIRAAGHGDSPFDKLKSAVYQHIGGGGRDDDLTLVEVTMVEARAWPAPAPPEEAPSEQAAQDWSLSLELGPRSLASQNPLPLLQHVVAENPQLRPHAGAIYTVLGELYSNALEHGVMGLDSRLKSSAGGFAAYYDQRARALACLEGHVRFDLRCRVEGGTGELSITVTDSGSGFDYSRRLERPPGESETTYHGRGMRLLRQFCQSLTYRGCGNEVEALYAWNYAGGKRRG